jgi:hypothetical protein
MTPYVSTQALERAITAQMKSAQSLEERRSAEGYDALQEIETQYQVPIWGIATARPAWSTFTLAFDVQFVFAPEQRDSPLSVPHFSFGPVVSGVASPDETNPDPDNPDSLVAVFCQVVEWGRDLAADAVIGAVLGVGVSTLGGADVKFDGYVHLSFEGYGTIAETDASALDLG